MEYLSNKIQSLLDHRDELLQSSLRPASPMFPIAAEYPIVLARDASNLSLGLIEDQHVIAHANLWPRVLTDQKQSVNVGLIGNVATQSERRGGGLMRQLLEDITQEATAKGLAALFLWSDLSQFYQKMGFQSCGQEIRITLQKSAAQRFQALKPQRTRQFFPISADKLTASDLRVMLNSRPSGIATLLRSVEEFKQLLSIPMTNVLRDQTGHFVIMGKGYDMAGVIHEWGMEQPSTLVEACLDIFTITALDAITILLPSTHEHWTSSFKTMGAEISKHPVMLAKILDAKKMKSLLDSKKLFIWGLDSI